MVFACGKSFVAIVWLLGVVAGTSVLHVEEYMVFIFDSFTYVDGACLGAIIAGVLGFLAKRVPLYAFLPIL